ncbi:MAG TPA: hypothetical protein PLA91_00250 [Bacillota bacterium]|jgi:hypothetical protein|nr:hypothetical protein [Peptococcaceae bacterium MAG4]HPU35205.1 hypothetical protein [Bacillota bacterium]
MEKNQLEKNQRTLRQQGVFYFEKGANQPSPEPAIRAEDVS